MDPDATADASSHVRNATLWRRRWSLFIAMPPSPDKTLTSAEEERRSTAA
jgi:hypothetical protein